MSYRKPKIQVLLLLSLCFCMGLSAQPSWTSPSLDLSLDCEIGQSYDMAISDWLAAAGGGAFTDGCGSPALTNNYGGTPPDCMQDTLQIIFTVTDACMDVAMDTSNIIFLDQAPPAFNESITDLTINCTDPIPAIPVITVTDLCDPSPSLNFSTLNNQTSDGTCTDYNYSILRVWNTMDACGNVDTLRQTVFVEDIEAPTFTRPSNITINCTDDISPTFTGGVTNVNDNCNANPIVNFTDFITFVGCPNNYSIARFWNVTDACGNAGTPQEQTITVQDNLDPVLDVMPVDLTFECSNPTLAEQAFQDWLTNNAGGVASDNCTAPENLTWFAAVPGTYNPNNFNTFPGTSPGTLSPGTCDNNVNGVFRSETVDFVVYDECKRTTVTQVTFNLADQNAPVFEFCPEDVTITADVNCLGQITLPLPIVSESCDFLTDSFTGTVSENFTSTDPGNQNVIVNSLTLIVEGIPTPPSVASGPANIAIALNQVDGEAAAEFFNIVLEDGTTVGQTNPTDSQCGNSMTSFIINPNDFKLLVLDGKLEITLVPNVPTGQSASFGVNDICPSNGGGSSASLTVEFDYNIPPNLDLTYSIGSGIAIDLDLANTPTLTFGTGTHLVNYMATDCVGNESICSFQVTIEDNGAPMISCPNDVTLYLGVDEDCSMGLDYILDRPDVINTDCGFSSQAQVQPLGNDQLITFAFDPNYLTYVAEAKDFNFTGVSANAVGVNVSFTVEVEGDIEDAQEYFIIYGEDGSVMGTTRVGIPYVTYTPGDCPGPIQKAVADLLLPVATYNEWASDGVINLQAIPNSNYVLPPPGDGEEGINPSCIEFAPGTPDGSTDGLSKISIRMESQIATTSYSISGVTTQAIQPMPQPQGTDVATFALGMSTVTYVVADGDGNEGNCSFEITVLDTIKPEVFCSPTTIFVNPSGVENYTLQTTEIDNGSFDNCGIVSQEVSPSEFSCSQIGTSVEVTYTIEDAAGNINSCTSMVAIEAELPVPSFSVSLCGNDSLLLFANPPEAQGGVVYTFNWSGPNGFTSTLENPVILNASANDTGPYSVSIEGLMNCTISGVVEVILNADIAKPIIAEPAITCQGGELNLITNIGDGNSYTWTRPDFTTIVTTTPNLLITNISAGDIGNWTVQVFREGCLSPSSDPVNVQIENTPNIFAANNSPVCEGATVDLFVNILPGISYQWIGPNNFSAIGNNISTVASPGVYTVTAFSQNGCTSQASTTVITTERPVIDDLQVISPSCLDGGTNVAIEAEVITTVGGLTYQWTGPNSFASISNPAILPNATSNDNGAYILTATDGNGCSSTPAEILFDRNDVPQTPVISGPTMACEGEDVVFTSTAYVDMDVSYNWQTNAGEIITQDPSLILTNVSSSESIQLFVTVDGCDSPFSAVQSLTVQSTPVAPVITGTEMVCEGEAIDLNTPLIAGAIYTWSGPGGFSSAVHNPTIFNALPANAGTYQVQIQISGCGSALSNAFNVAVGSSPTTPAIEPTLPVCVSDLNASIDLTISQGTAVAGAEYTWFEAGTNNFVAGPTNSLSISIDDLSPFTGSSAEFYVVADVMGCGSAQSVPQFVELFNIPTEEAFAGDDFLLCDAVSLNLEAGTPGVGTGNWEQISGPSDPLLADPTNPNSSLSELQSNQTYVFSWTLSNGACVDYDTDEVMITYEQIPQANPDEVSIPFAGEAAFNVKENDQIDIQFFIEVLESPSQGTLIETGEGNFAFEAFGNFAGTDEFTYQVCNANCPTSCTSAKVTLNIGANAPCDIPSMITPNGDGVNDEFVIPCVSSGALVNNRVTIFNQWGDEVFRGSPYQNDWSGTYNGEDLPVGTYYYVVDFGNGQSPSSGFVIIER